MLTTSTPHRSDIIAFRVSPTEDRLIRAAAVIRNGFISDLVREAALREAERTLAERPGTDRG